MQDNKSSGKTRSGRGLNPSADRARRKLVIGALAGVPLVLSLPAKRAYGQGMSVIYGNCASAPPNAVPNVNCTP